MTLLEEIKQCNNMHRLPKNVHLNRDCLLDFRLFQTLENPGNENNYTYDFDVYLPDYKINLQRPYVWEHHQQNEFILSLLLEKPIESFVVIQHVKDKDRSAENIIMLVIDGKQRMMTIQKFIHNEFPVVINGRDVYYKDFDDETRLFFRSRVNSLCADIYYSYWNEPITDEQKVILFNYYNFAGTPQTEEHKNKLQALININ